MLIGYARVSTPSQNLDRQVAALRAVGCDTIFREKVSGAAVKNRPQLERAIDALGTGDILVVAEWDRATRSMMDGIHIMQRIALRDAAIKVLDKPHLDLTTPQLDLFPTDLHLRCIDPASNKRRFHTLSVQRTLFEEWVLVHEWGRIGLGGRLRHDLYPSAGIALPDALRTAWS